MDIFIICLVVKLLHALFLWFMFFLAEKIALQAFITTVYVDGAEPPTLTPTVLRVFIADAVFCFILFAGVYFYISSGEDAVIGGRHILFAIGADLLLTWKLSFIVTSGVAWIAQSQSCCRFKDDGLRGIRAFCLTSLYLSLVILGPPYYMIL